MTHPVDDADVEAVAVAILTRRIQPDYSTPVTGEWQIDHDVELAKAAIAALLERGWRPPRSGTGCPP